MYMLCMSMRVLLIVAVIAKRSIALSEGKNESVGR